MFMSIIYMASSWLRARRLNSLKSKINAINTWGCVSFYKKTGKHEDLEVSPTSSSFCKNRLNGKVSEILYYEPDLRACAIHPKQIVNIKNWIGFNEGDLCPIHISDTNATLDAKKLYLLIEADCIGGTDCIAAPESLDMPMLYLNEVGILIAWRMEGALGVIIESDLEHLAKLLIEYTTEHFYLNVCFEVRRVQTVQIEGKPCQVVHEPRSRESPHEVQSERGLAYLLDRVPSPAKWKDYFNLFKTYSTCADLALLGGAVHTPQDEYVTINAGSSGELNDPEDGEVRRQWSHTHSIGGRDVLFLDSVSSAVRLVEQRMFYESSWRDKADEHTRPAFKPLRGMRSPNILIYGESETTVENIKALLTETLEKNRYTIYTITEDQLVNSPWIPHCRLLVIGGNVPSRVEPMLISYVVRGGKMFCLCSGLLHTIIPYYKTAEIQERKLVYLSYKTWKRIPLLHSVFCYQEYSERMNFSADEPSDGRPEGRWRVYDQPSWSCTQNVGKFPLDDALARFISATGVPFLCYR